jgi:NADH:ubiquinone reductase (H+-translocating)
MRQGRKNIVVIGAGFAGIDCVKALVDADCNVALFDRHNYHLFQPLLYQVATAALSPADIAYPIRRIFRHQQNVQIVLGEVETIDLARRLIRLSNSEQDFDYLVLAAGATHSYRGRNEWSGRAPGLKSIDDALEIRRRILIAFEEAEDEMDDAARRAKLTFVVVGGGPTGVELAGALREIAARDIPRDFRHIDTTSTRVILIQGGDRLLPSFHPSLSDRAKSDLEAMGVDVRLGGRVTDIGDGALRVGDELIPAQNVFWAAGVEAPKLTRSLGVELDNAGRIKVLPDLSVPGHPTVFVAGDLASVIDPNTNQPVPGLAPAAMQMGRHVGRILRDEVTVSPRPPEERPAFEYVDKGSMATIGKAWCFVHLMFLIGFRSKLFVVVGWVWSYLFSRRTVRLITGSAKPNITSHRDVTPNSI